MKDFPFSKMVGYLFGDSCAFELEMLCNWVFISQKNYVKSHIYIVVKNRW